MADVIDFQNYLDSICRRYAEWWNLDTLTGTLDSQQPLFDFKQMAQLVLSRQRSNGELTQEQPKPLPLFQGFWHYLDKGHLLLIGRPGAGKSTALARLLVDASEQAKPDPMLQKHQTKIPVLVELGLYPVRLRNESGILDLIENFLEANECSLEIETIRKLLTDKRFLLLLDGVNELPKEALTDLKAFERKPLPMVFTARDSDQGGLNNIKQKLELQPLPPTEVQRFIQEQMPGQDGQKLKQLSDRIRDFGETPLVIWMLYQVFQQTGEIPETLGEAFYEFTQRYERNYKAGVQVSEESRHQWAALLSNLAFEMIKTEKPFFEKDVKETFRWFLESEQASEPTRKAEEFLEDLLNHHLIQRRGKNQIRFCHQLLQEYYAAEKLLEMLRQEHPDLIDDKRFQHYYLNYLKWTEAIALMLGLLNNEFHTLRVIKLALEDVDWTLGASLVSSLKTDFQEKAVDLVSSLKVQEWLKIELLGLTKSNFALKFLLGFMSCSNDICHAAIFSAGVLGSSEAKSELLKLLERSEADIREMAAESLGLLSWGEDISLLFSYVSDRSPKVRAEIISILGRLKTRKVLPYLIDAMKDSNFRVKFNASCYLKEICCEEELEEILPGGKEIDLSSDPDFVELIRGVYEDMIARKEVLDSSSKSITDLIKELQASDHEVRSHAVQALIELRYQFTFDYLPYLRKFLSTAGDWETYSMISETQSRFGLYNYDIAHWSPPLLPISSEENATKAQDILEIIFNVGVSLERSSKEVRQLPEESLREFFIPAINARYPDSATPETRNKNGRTDILVRIANKNVLLVECKFWGSEKKLREALDQLLIRYTTVRDTQLLLLIFSRNKDFTDVKRKIPQAMKQHSSFGRELSIDLEKPWYQYVVFHPDDRACELTLTVLAFHIPSQ